MSFFSNMNPTKWLIVGAGVVLALWLLFTVIRGLANDERAENNQLVNTGAAIERGRQNEETVNAVTEGLDARHNASDAERRVVCEKYDRNCKNDQ